MNLPIPGVIFATGLLLSLCGNTYAQKKRDSIPPQDTIPALIHVEESPDSLRFSATLRPLRQVAGAPASFYTYFWELGDGSFSFDQQPRHQYKDTGTYQVRLYATNNYDDGKAPPTRPHPVKIKNKPSISRNLASHFFHENRNLEMKINRNPKPGEDFVAVIGYRNSSEQPLEGSIVLFLNEKQFQRDGFKLDDRRMYFGEDTSSLALLTAQLQEREQLNKEWLAGPQLQQYYTYTDEAKSLLQNLQVTYSQHTVLRFKNMEKDKEQFVFMSMNTLPEMIQDTNATVTMTAVLVPDNATLAPEVFELEMQIVASHDPNRLQLKQHRINYRFMGKKKELTYKVRFQNTGKGPAKKVAIGIAIPKQLNTQTITVKSMSPACTWCDSAYSKQSCIDTIRTADSIHFVFSNIYLPGMQQDGVSDKDSTKGFVEYTIRFKKKPKKIPFSSRAAIVFDKNEPVYTNRSIGRFIKGISPGIVAGYNVSPSSGIHKLNGPLQIGVLLAPYAPSKPYFQVEAYAGFMEKETSTARVNNNSKDTSLNGQDYLIVGREEKRTIQRNTLQIVPLHYRYNINQWLGIGVGASAQVSITEQTTTEQRVALAGPQRPGVVIATATDEVKSGTDWFGYFNAAPFADLQIGRVKNGPAVGFRYLRQLKGETKDRIFAYAVFRL